MQNVRNNSLKLIECGLFSASFYAEQLVGSYAGSEIDLACHYYEFGQYEGLCPCGEFDPLYYSRQNPDLTGIGDLTRHYIDYGKKEGRIASLASHLVAEDVDVIAIEEDLIPEPELNQSDPRYLDSLARALRKIDSDPNLFSSEYYITRYPDLEGQALHPLVHYLKYGRTEGRVTNISLMKNVYVNRRIFDEHRPNILVGIHESSTTGAPIVGMDLARELSSSYNIIFISLRDGPLTDIAKEEFPVVILASEFDDNNYIFVDYIMHNFPVEDAIFSSTACVPFIRPFSSTKVRITCLVHEFLEYMIHARSVIYLCDLLIFSSKQLLKSWQYMLEDLNRDPSTLMVLPQPTSSANVRAMDKKDARAVISEATGLDLEGATLVLGAGHIQIRKGTDIFLQIGNQLRREKEKFVVVWIGQQISEFDMAFGVWFHAQMERARDGNGALSVHFEPAGPLYSVLMDAADIFLVTSRLDPLPNVALDAAARDVPVISFHGATGLADIADHGGMDLTEVEMGSVDQMVMAIKSRSKQS